jgi:general secretion pathway protein B
MSFILDALKKAESERNRHIAPVLMDARLAPPRRGLPAWGWALGAVLLVNLGVLTWLLLRSPPEQPAPTAAVAADTAGASAPPTAAPITPAAAPAAPAAEVVANAEQTVTTVPPAPAAPPPAYNSPALTSDLDTLPTAQELAGAGVPLPELQLNLHVYDPAPGKRSVLLNGQRLREGEYSPNGVKIERIMPDYVVLEASGRRFRLLTGG